MVMRLGGLEDKLILCNVEELQCQILVNSIYFFNSYPANIKKGSPPGPGVRTVVSAGRLFPWQAWYLAKMSVHSFPAIPA